jgi:hypothetical protein
MSTDTYWFAPGRITRTNPLRELRSARRRAALRRERIAALVVLAAGWPLAVGLWVALAIGGAS